MIIRHFDRAEDFVARAMPFLVSREGENNLVLGICGNLIQGAAYTDEPPYFVTVEDEGQVKGAAIRTPPFRLVLSTMDEAAIPLVAGDARERFGLLPGVNGRADLAQAFAEVWLTITGRSYRVRMAMRTFQLTTVRPVSGVPGAFRRAEKADRDILNRWSYEFNVEALGDSDRAHAEETVEASLQGGPRALYLWEDGRPVTMAGTSGPTPNGIRVMDVYTPPDLRRRGYASACVAALSQRLLDEGRKFVFLFTDLANPTSNHIYQEIGYEAVCDVSEYVFD